MLILSRKAGESLMIGDEIEITIIEVSGDKVRIGIDAPKNVQIYRRELYLTIENNKQATGLADAGELRQLLDALKGRKPGER